MDETADQLSHRAPLDGRYQMVRLIARGGMAEVWEAEDLVLQRAVAVKVLRAHLAADATSRLRFRSEAIAAARLRHPGIVAIYDTCSDGGREAIVMELARSRTLRDELDNAGALSPREVVQVGVAVADALAAAHEAGVVHRDIKPANILLCDDGRVLVTDFGIAKVRDEADLTTTGMMVGTLKYLSPEQVEGAPADPRSDIYSLGAVLYEAASGRAPFEAETPAAVALARLQREPASLGSLRPDLPPGLARVITRALARAPELRYPSAVAFRAALEDRDALLPPPRPAPSEAAPTVVAAAPVPPPAPAEPTIQAPVESVLDGWEGHHERWEDDQESEPAYPQLPSLLTPLLLIVVIVGSVALAAALLLAR